MINKLNSLFLFLIILLAVLYYQANAQTVNEMIQQAIVAPTITPTTPIPTATPTPTIALPVKLIIPKLNIESNIEFVGLDSNGKMQIPSQFDTVGWYNLSYKPGEIGTAVIDGHYDTVTGSPAVFYYLNTLQPGDDIFVVDEDNLQQHFIVQKKDNYDLNNIPIEDIFSNTDDKYLNLITCYGNWDYKTHNYSHRTVIFSKLYEN